MIDHQCVLNFFKTTKLPTVFNTSLSEVLIKFLCLHLPYVLSSKISCRFVVTITNVSFSEILKAYKTIEKFGRLQQVALNKINVLSSKCNK